MVAQKKGKSKGRSCRTEEPIYIGGIFSLTGYLSWLGIYKKKASELKVDLINSSGGIEGRMLKLITYDDGSKADQAAKAAEALIYKHRAISLVGTGSLPVSLAVARIANKNRVPAFLNSGYAIDPVKDLFVFNTAHKTEFALACAFQYFSERDISRVALLMPYGPLGEVGSWLARHLSSFFNIKIVGEERFDLTIPDIKGQLGRIKDLKPQAVFSFVTGRPAAWVAGSMASMNFHIPLLISHGNATPSFLRMISSIPLKVIVPSGKTMVLDALSQDDPSVKKIMDFNSIHMARFGEPANYYSAEQADAIDLITIALKATAGRPNELKDALESINNFAGLQGVYNLSSIDHYGTGPESMVLLSVKDGRWCLERTFSSLNGFGSIYSDGRTNLTHRLAGILIAPYLVEKKKNEREHILSTPYVMDDSAGLINIDHNFFINYHRYKREMIKAIYDENEIGARQNLYLILSLALNTEEDEFLRGIILEIFGALCDTALDKGVGIEEIAGLKGIFMEKWISKRDRDNLCLILIRSLYQIMDMISKTESNYYGLLKRVMSFIKANYNEDIDVEKVARHVCLSTSYLIHKMKRQFGVSLTECIARVRVENAKALLKLTDTPVGKIAHEVGYQDQCYFTKVFKRYTGFTPNEYRKSPEKYIPSKWLNTVSSLHNKKS